MLWSLFVLFAIVVIVLFFAAPRWLGKASTDVARRTRVTFRKNVSEFKKGTREHRENRPQD